MKALEVLVDGCIRTPATHPKKSSGMLFLNATPGAREIVILSKIADLLEDYDQVIVDLPASGHALGILRVPGTAMQLMRSGPIYERAKQILQVFSNPRAMVLLCALPEEMVVNETVEFAEKIRKDVPQFKNLGVLLNRVSVPSFNQDETTLLSRLSQATNGQNTDKDVQNVVEAAVWDEELEDASLRAIERLNAELGYAVCLYPNWGFGWIWWWNSKVVQQMTTIFSRKYRTERHECHLSRSC